MRCQPLLTKSLSLQVQRSTQMSAEGEGSWWRAGELCPISGETLMTRLDNGRKSEWCHYNWADSRFILFIFIVFWLPWKGVYMNTAAPAEYWSLRSRDTYGGLGCCPLARPGQTGKHQWLCNSVLHLGGQWSAYPLALEESGTEILCNSYIENIIGLTGLPVSFLGSLSQGLEPTWDISLLSSVTTASKACSYAIPPSVCPVSSDLGS